MSGSFDWPSSVQVVNPGATRGRVSRVAPPPAARAVLVD